jgi:hypothetical protein
MLRSYQGISPGLRHFETFHNNKKCLRLGVVGPTLNPQAGGPPPVGCPRLLIRYIRSYSPYPQDFPPSATWGRAMPWWEGTHLTWVALLVVIFIITLIIFYEASFSPSSCNFLYLVSECSVQQFVHTLLCLCYLLRARDQVSCVFRRETERYKSVSRTVASMSRIKSDFSFLVNVILVCYCVTFLVARYSVSFSDACPNASHICKSVLFGLSAPDEICVEHGCRISVLPATERKILSSSRKTSFQLKQSGT